MLIVQWIITQWVILWKSVLIVKPDTLIKQMVHIILQ